MSNTIGETIRALRREQNATQEQLAEYLGLSGQSVSKWENKIANPDVEYLPGIARFFGVTVDSLFSAQEELPYAEYKRLIEQGGFLQGEELNEAIALLERMCARYPRDYRLLCEYVAALCMKRDPALTGAILSGSAAILKNSADPRIHRRLTKTLAGYLSGTGAAGTVPAELPLAQEIIDALFPPRSAAARGNRILLADDAPFMRRAIREIAEKAGCEPVGEVGDGEEAVRMSEELMPDIVILDVVMPALDGIDAARSILKRDPGTCVLLCSVMAQKSVVMKAVRLGIRALIAKPFLPECLEAALGDLLREAPDAGNDKMIPDGRHV